MESHEGALPHQFVGSWGKRVILSSYPPIIGYGLALEKGHDLRWWSALAEMSVCLQRSIIGACGWGKSAFLLESISVGYGSTCCPHQRAWTLAVKPAQLSAFGKHLRLPLSQLWQAVPLVRHCLPWLGLLSDVVSRFQTLLCPPPKQLWEHMEKAEGELLSEILRKCQGWLSPLFFNEYMPGTRSPRREKVVINVTVLVYERWCFDFSFFSPQGIRIMEMLLKEQCGAPLVE